MSPGAGRLALLTVLLTALLSAWGLAAAQPSASPVPDGAAPVSTAPFSAAPVGVLPVDPPAQDPAYTRDLLPIAVLGLAVGGGVGFELSRRGL